MSTNHYTSASDPCLFTLEMIDSSLLDDWQLSHRRLLFYFRLESYERFERTKFAGKYGRTNTLIKHSHETSYEACYERIYEVPTNLCTKSNKTTPSCVLVHFINNAICKYC